MKPYFIQDSNIANLETLWKEISIMVLLLTFNNLKILDFFSIFLLSFPISAIYVPIRLKCFVPLKGDLLLSIFSLVLIT